ncbi:MAG TPA: hypothetical protein VKB88_29615 [Bryobacteraceae bacterium]|nr:hypothetical protein [Bryobacteraceae bacterium]
MKRSRKIIGLCLLAIIVGIVFYLYADSAAPAGQPPLARLDASNFSELSNAFNEAKDTVRVVAMLSPT